MPETYEKKDKDTLTVTRKETSVYDEDRVGIQGQLDHLETEKVCLQEKIDKEKAKIAILDG